MNEATTRKLIVFGLQGDCSHNVHFVQTSASLDEPGIGRSQPLCPCKGHNLIANRLLLQSRLHCNQFMQPCSLAFLSRRASPVAFASVQLESSSHRIPLNQL